MEKHINVIAALRIGFSILDLLIGALIYLYFILLVILLMTKKRKRYLTIVANVIIVVIIVLSIPGIIAGIGLFKRKEWARILTLILSVLDLFNIPIGTAIGAYSIWALVQPEVVEQFKTNS